MKKKKDSKYEPFLTREEDLQFQKNTERIAGERHGIEIGKKEGKKEGRKQGRHENSIEVAKILINENSPIDLIVKASRLPISKINKLIKQYQKEALRV